MSPKSTNIDVKLFNLAIYPDPSEQRKEDDLSNQNQQNQQDWSILWSCFESPISLLHFQNGLPKGMQEMVFNAVAEMRRYYSRKVIDVLIKVTRTTLDTMRRKFLAEAGNNNYLGFSKILKNFVF